MKKKYFLTLDTETATLPFANEIAKTPKEKQNIAIAKPLVYDIGWVISDRNGNIIKKENFLVQETFFVPSVFNTAYYKDKRPIYMEMLKNGEISVKCWDEIVEILLTDLRQCDLATAYNAAFDFKKAIPFTERYIRNLYSDRYNEWEERQREICKRIAKGEESGKNETFLEPVFILRDEEFPIADLWYIACDRLVNNQRYKNFCLDNEFITQSGIYFKTSAETTFAYLIKDSEFIESHTALDDARIEMEILTKALKKGKVEPIMQAFPFRDLGTTYEYVRTKTKYAEIVANRVKEHLDTFDNNSAYTTRLENIYYSLMAIVEEM